MRTYLSGFSGIALAAALAAGGLTVSGCAPFASQGDINEHEASIRGDMQKADTANAARTASVDQAAQDAMARATSAEESAKHPFVRQVLMKDDSVTFETNKAVLTPEAQATLTSFAEKLKSENKNVYIEIQGHGDTRGSPEHNKQLGQQRAEAVRRFLSSQGVPLDRMSTISYGEEQPKAGESTEAAHAENRRVVLIVMG